MKRFASILLLLYASIASAAGPQPCYFSGQYVQCFPPLGLRLNGATQGLTVAAGITATGAITTNKDMGAGANTLQVINENNSSGATDPRINYVTGRGSYASPTATQSGDFLLSFNIFGVTGTTANNADTGNAANIVVTATENYTASNHAGKVEIFTTKNSAGGNAVRFRVDNDGGTTITETTGGSGNVPHNCTRDSSTPATLTTATVTCASGKRLMGGGCDDNNAVVGLIQSYPSSDTVWTCTWASAVASARATGICCTY